jgi:hypothetical protein
LLWQNLIKWSVDIIYKCIISFVFGNIWGTIYFFIYFVCEKFLREV